VLLKQKSSAVNWSVDLRQPKAAVDDEVLLVSEALNNDLKIK